MAKISTRVTFDKTTAMARIKAANNKALFIMGQQALKDANMHVPIDQHTLEESGIENSDEQAVDGKYNLIWATDYAQYLWNGELMHGDPLNRTYGPEKLNFTSALAREEWAKYAKETYGTDWKKVYQAALRLEMSKS